MKFMRLPDLPVVLLPVLLTVVSHPAPAQTEDWEDRSGREINQTFGAAWLVATGDPPYGDRLDPAVVSHEGHIYLIGGHAPTQWHNDVWRSRDGVDWELLIDNAPWSPRSTHLAVSHKGRIWMMGGYDGLTKNDVWSSAEGQEWREELSNAPWASRTHFQLLVLEDHIYLLGGQGSWKRKSDVWRSADGVTWEELTSAAPWRPRSHFAATVHNNRIIVTAGGYFDFDRRLDEYNIGHYVYLNDVWASDDGATWEQLTESAEFSPRILAHLASVDGLLYLVGGDDDMEIGAHNRMTWVSETGETWNLLRNPSERYRLQRRNNFALLVHDDMIWTFGGANYAGMIYRFRNQVYFTNGRPPNPETD